ncbi:MAG: chemotaxis protein CheW [Negativicutes bacterium]|nr:chemotaxis protein CheW [Negativicutes bacterium]
METKGQQDGLGDELQLVVLRLSGEEYGLRITDVQEINRLQSVTKMPQMPYHVKGVINLRGRLIPIVDLAQRLGIGEASRDDDARIVVVESGDKSKAIGYMVDGVSEVLRIRTGDIEGPPAGASVDSAYIDGVCKLEGRLIILLNIAAVMAD